MEMDTDELRNNFVESLIDRLESLDGWNIVNCTSSMYSLRSGNVSVTIDEEFSCTVVDTDNTEVTSLLDSEYVAIANAAKELHKRRAKQIDTELFSKFRFSAT